MTWQSVESASGGLAKRISLWGSLSTDSYALLVIVQVWLVALIVINPLGDFPIADDWAYFASVKALVEHGHLAYSNWAAPNLVSQVVWGALFALPFGTSYTVLRVSTEVLAAIAAVALYLTLREGKCPPGIALTGALLFLLNPLVCVMSASFMSDVPYTAMQTVAMWLLIAGLRSTSTRQLRLGWITAGLALLCRQVGMAIPLGFGAARLARTGFGWRRVALATVPFAGFAVFQIVFQAGLRHWQIIPANFGQQINLMISNVEGSGFLQLAGGFFRLAGECAYYFGLFLLPLSLLVVARFTRSLGREIALLIWFWPSLIAALLVLLGPEMPVWSNNVIEAWSLGGVDVTGVPPPGFFWPLITALSAFGAVMLLLALALNCATLMREIRKPSATGALFAAATALALLGSVALLPRGTQFDRYIIPVIPCLIIFLSMQLRVPMVTKWPVPRWAPIAGGIIFGAIASYSILGTHDFLAEKRTQWTALQDLIANNRIPPDIIDADWVYNAPTSFGVYGDPNDLGTWFRRQDYLVYSDRKGGVTDRSGYARIRTYPVTRWAPWDQAPGDIVVMHRIAAPR